MTKRGKEILRSKECEWRPKVRKRPRERKSETEKATEKENERKTLKTERATKEINMIWSNT